MATSTLRRVHGIGEMTANVDGDIGERPGAAAAGMVRAGAALSGALDDVSAGQPAPVRHCDACGAEVVLVGAEAKGVPVRWGDAWFCDDCVRTLPEAEIEGRTGEIALRGVPLS